MHNIGIIFKKELLDTIRDRRTIVSMIVIPVIVFPLLMLGFSSFAMKMEQKSREEIQKVAIVGGQNAPKLVAMIDTLSTVKVTPFNPDSIESAINDKILWAAAIIPDNFEDRILDEDTTSLLLIYNKAEIKSNFALNKLEGAARNYRDMVIRDRLVSKGLDPGLIKPFVIAEKNVAEKKMGSFVLSMMIPYIIIILSMIGAMYTAIDLTAGEKERGTLETILVSPIPRWQLATGKFLTILTTSFVSTVLVLVSMIATMYFGIFSSPAAAELSGFDITPMMIFVIFLLMIPTAAMLSAILMSVSLFAKSYREAQSYVSPLMLLAILPAMISFMPGVELDSGLALIPLVNISLSIKNALMGHVNWLYVGLVFISTVVYAAFAIFIAHRLFEKESVIFRS